MPHDDVYAAFSALDGPDRAGFSLRPRSRSGASRWWVRLAAIAAVGSVGLASAYYYGGLLPTGGVAPPAGPGAVARIVPPIRVAPPAPIRPLPSAVNRLQFAANTTPPPPNPAPKPKPQPRPKPPAPSGSLKAARSTVEPATTPEPARPDVEEATTRLSAKGITRGESGFQLTSETVAATRLVKLRERATELNQADARLAYLNQILAYLKELDLRMIALNQEIAGLGNAMAQFPATWARGRWFHGTNNWENDAFEGFKAQKLACERVRDVDVRPEIGRLRADQPGRLRDEAIPELKRLRQAAVTALDELKEAITSTRQGYTDLATDAEVKQALDALGGATFGPTEGFVKAERECREFEQSATRLGLTNR